MAASFKLSIAAIVIFILQGTLLYGQKPTMKEISRSRWVDSVYKSLSDTERIGQLFMVAAYSGGKDYNEDTITQLVQNGHVGGLIFMQGTPEAQATQNNKYQKLAKVPLMIGMDAEWG